MTRFQRLASFLSVHQNACLIVLLSILAIATHVAWFTPGTILFQNDWLHRPTETVPQSWDMAQAWKGFFHFGAPNIQIGYFIVSILWPIIGFFGGDFDTAVKLTLMIPTAFLGFLAPYFAVRYLTKNNFIAFTTSLFYGSTTYFLLSQTVQVPIAFVYAIAPLVFYLYIKAIDSKKIHHWLWFALAFTIGACYEVRIMYLVAFILFFYSVINFKSLFRTRRHTVLFLITSAVLLGLNSFWLLPTLLGGISSSVSQQTSTALFGDWLFDLPHALALSISGWTGGPLTGEFILEPIKPYLWIIPALIFVPFIIQRHRVPPKLLFFFFTLALLGIFLTKQSTEPLADAYSWLYSNLPGFSLFREASKFYLFTAFGYMGLLAIALLVLRNNHRRFYYAGSVVIILIAAVNLFPLFTTQIGGVFVSRQEPAAYRDLRESIARDNQGYRTLWVPTFSQWGYFDTEHPRASISALLSQEWKSYISEHDARFPERVKSFFESSFANQVLDRATIKYVIVPARDAKNDDNYYRQYGDERQAYVTMLDQVPWLKKVSSDGAVDVYENTGFKGYVSASNDVIHMDEQHLHDTSAVAKNDSTPFVLDKPSSPHSSFKDLYRTAPDNLFKDGTFSHNLPNNQTHAIMTDSQRYSYDYRAKKDRVDFFRTQTPRLTINSDDTKGANPEQLGAQQLNESNQYVIATGRTTHPVDRSDKQRSFGTTAEPIDIYAQSKQNILPNASFEAGPWNPTVKDCNPYDSNGDITQSIDSTLQKEGRYSLKLGAFKHTACSESAQIPVTAGQVLNLSYFYALRDTQRAGYEIAFNDSKNSVISDDQQTRNGGWQQISHRITVPAGASHMTIKLKGYPDDRRMKYAYTNYDDVRITELRHVSNISKGTNVNITSTPLDSSTMNVNLPEPPSKNLVKNHSLESGLWAKQVEDCNNYDDKARIEMSETSQASHGNKALELRAKKHIACTGPDSVAVDEGSVYRLSFDYQSPNSTIAGYSISYNDPNNTMKIKRLNVPSTEWRSIQELIQVPHGASRASIKLYGYSNEDNSSEKITRYDNVSLANVPDSINQQYLVSTPKNAGKAPDNISYKKIDSTHTRVSITAASKPFYLHMSESYNDGWKLRHDHDDSLRGAYPFISASPTASSEHLRTNGFMNGWYVDPSRTCQQQNATCTKHPDGTYDMSLMIEYLPQRWYNIGIVIASVSLVATCIILAASLLRQRRTRS